MSFSNPFITDRPLTDQDLFVGRGAEFAQLLDMLGSDQRTICLFGHHHLGKTSFVNQLALRLHPRWQVMQIDLATTQIQSEAGLIQTIAQRLGETGQESQKAEVSPSTEAWSAIEARMETERPCLVCLDQITTADLTERKSSWLAIMQSVQRALSSSAKLALLLCIEGHPADLDQALLEGVSVIELSSLDEHESEELLSIPLRGKLALGYEIIRASYVLTGGDPYLLQLFGSFCHQRYAKMGWVPANGVSHLSEDVLQAAEEHFRELWDPLSDRARLVLSTMCETTGQHGICTPGDASRLLAASVRLLRGDVNHGLTELHARGILDELGGPTYRVASDIMRVWVRRTHPLDATIASSSTYRSRRVKVPSTRRRRQIDWAGIALWSTVILLVVAIAWVWRSRDVTVVWMHRPTLDVPPTAESEGSEALPTPEAGLAQGYIVYQAKEDPDEPWDLYIMRSDGSDPVRLTNTPSNETLPVLSPDGRKIAFVSDRDGNREVYVMNRNGSDQTNLSRNAADDWTPSWSPDGTEIAFASFRDGHWELYLMTAEGTSQRRITSHSAADYSPAWSPTGDEIAFVSNRTGNLDIHLLSLADLSVQRLTTDPATDQSPAWSPDGQQIAWESYRDGNMEIFAMDADGSDVRNLSQDVYADDHGVTWAPTGERIAFYSNRDGGWDIYTLDLATGRRLNLTLGNAIEQSPCWGR